MVLQDVSADYLATDTVVFAVSGSDPWFGAPLFRLEREDGSLVTRSNGSVFDSDGYGFYVDLQVDPDYSDAPDASSRQFRWIVSLPVQHRVTSRTPDLPAVMRFSAQVPVEDDASVLVLSEWFSVP